VKKSDLNGNGWGVHGPGSESRCLHVAAMPVRRLCAGRRSGRPRCVGALTPGSRLCMMVTHYKEPRHG
jgi:hypothetical protein